MASCNVVPLHCTHGTRCCPLQLGITCQVMCTPEQQKQWLEKAKAVAAKMGAKTTQLVYIKESQAGESASGRLVQQ